LAENAFGVFSAIERGDAARGWQKTWFLPASIGGGVFSAIERGDAASGWLRTPGWAPPAKNVVFAS
jgi:hypothetical protein